MTTSAERKNSVSKTSAITLMLLGMTVSGCVTTQTGTDCELPEVPELPPIDEDGLVRLDEEDRVTLLTYINNVEACKQ
nr:hypothetical protein 13 [Saccharospirillaceae bacterium]